MFDLSAYLGRSKFTHCINEAPLYYITDLNYIIESRISLKAMKEDNKSKLQTLQNARDMGLEFTYRESNSLPNHPIHYIRLGQNPIQTQIFIGQGDHRVAIGSESLNDSH